MLKEPFDLFLQIKDSVVKTVSEIQVGNLQSLTQVTSVIARATLEPSEVTFDTQVCVTSVNVEQGCSYTKVQGSRNFSKEQN